MWIFVHPIRTTKAWVLVSFVVYIVILLSTYLTFVPLTFSFKYIKTRRQAL